MIDNITLYSQISLLPDDLKKEALDFINYLLFKHQIVATKDQKKPRPQFGSAKGKFVLAEDFDAPLDDLKEYME